MSPEALHLMQDVAQSCKARGIASNDALFFDVYRLLSMLVNESANNAAPKVSTVDTSAKPGA